MKKIKLSIIILSYNTKDLLKNCLLSLERVRNEIDFEVIVPDNGSSDGSLEMLRRDFPWVKKVIEIGENLGFARGNNKARDYVDGEYVLFLNSDTLVYKKTLLEMVNFMDINKKVGASTCKVVLKNGRLDKDTRRSFITPWIGLTHIYLRLDRIFPKSRIFAKYWYGYIPEDQIHEVDAIQGAFFLVRKKILDEVGWFDEDYFLDGEDIDLCWKIRNAGWKIVYYPKVKIMHIKGASKGKNKNVICKSRNEILKYRLAGVNSMEIFYRKRLWSKYPLLLNILVILGIKLLKTIRIIKILVFN